MPAIPGDEHPHTCTYSTILLSARSRVAESLVAGKAFGTTFRTVRRRELVTDSEEIVTVQQSVSIPFAAPSRKENTDT